MAYAVDTVTSTKPDGTPTMKVRLRQAQNGEMDVSVPNGKATNRTHIHETRQEAEREFKAALSAGATAEA